MQKCVYFCLRMHVNRRLRRRESSVQHCFQSTLTRIIDCNSETVSRLSFNDPRLLSVRPGNQDGVRGAGEFRRLSHAENARCRRRPLPPPDPPPLAPPGGQHGATRQPVARHVDDRPAEPGAALREDTRSGVSLCLCSGELFCSTFLA